MGYERLGRDGRVPAWAGTAFFQPSFIWHRYEYSKSEDGFLAMNSDGLDGVSHGYAPQGGASEQAPLPLRQLVRNLVDETNAAAQAEVALLKARGDLAKQGVKTTSIWGVIAFTTAFVALLATAFGAILALATILGPLGATAIIVGILTLIALLSAWRAKAGASDIAVAFRSDLYGEGDVK